MRKPRIPKGFVRIEEGSYRKVTSDSITEKEQWNIVKCSTGGSTGWRASYIMLKGNNGVSISIHTGMSQCSARKLFATPFAALRALREQVYAACADLQNAIGNEEPYRS